MKICTNCYHIGKGQHSKFLEGNVYFGLFSILVGLTILIGRDFFGSNTLSVIAGLFLLIMGSIRVIQHERGGKKCPRCKKDLMITLNNPEAQEIMKEHNLTIPKNPHA